MEKLRKYFANKLGIFGKSEKSDETTEKVLL